MPRESDVARQPVRILVVEDEFLIARAFQKGLERAGYVVCGLESRGRAAVAKALEEKPDYVLLDICLAGEMDGIEVARQIGEHLAGRVIFLTGFARGNVERRAVGIDFVAILTKPASVAEVVALIEADRSAARAI